MPSGQQRLPQQGQRDTGDRRAISAYRSASRREGHRTEHRAQTTKSLSPCYGWPPAQVAVVPGKISWLEPSRIEAIEDWPWLDQQVLRSSRSHRVCMTCHFFRHHPGPDCIPLLTCHFHQGLIAHGEHLTRSCSGWMSNQCRHGDWAPEVA